MSLQHETVAEIKIPYRMVLERFPSDIYAQFINDRMRAEVTEFYCLGRFKFLLGIEDEIKRHHRYFFLQAGVVDSPPKLLNFMTIGDTPAIIAMHKLVSEWIPLPNATVADDYDLRITWTITLIEAAHA